MNPVIKSESRDSLLFGEYEYCAKFYMYKLAGIRNLSHQNVEKYMEYQQAYDRFVNPGGSWKGSYNLQNNNTHSYIKKNLHILVDFFTSLENKFKLTVSYDYGYFYTNSLDDIKNLQKQNFISVRYVKAVVVDLPPNSMRVGNAKHDIRTYFCNQKITREQKQNFRKFVESQTDIRVGPSVEQFLYKYPDYTYISDNYFVDYNNESFLTMLKLVAPIKIRKTVALIRDK